MVYVIEAKSDGKSIFKIGTTANCPRMRLAQLSRQNAVPLELVAGLIGNKNDESIFHEAFKKWRLHGEWFSDCPGIRLLISDFPIKNWYSLNWRMTYGQISFTEAYRELTMLKFEDNPAC